MLNHLSEELQEELLLLPDEILLRAFSITRDKWYARQGDSEAFLSMLALGEAVYERGLEPPAPADPQAFERAVEEFLSTALAREDAPITQAM